LTAVNGNPKKCSRESYFHDEIYCLSRIPVQSLLKSSELNASERKGGVFETG
jgi:hypothetical protein